MSEMIESSNESNASNASNASLARIEANRRNAQLSTGPKTDAGKAAASQNALKHGLCSADPLAAVSSESSEERQTQLKLLADALRSDLAPVGAVEEVLFKRIVNLAYRLHGIPLIEQYVLTRERADRQRKLEYEELNKRRKDRGSVDPRELRRSALNAQTFLKSSDEYNWHVRLQRYESGAEKSFYRAVDALRKVQAAREEKMTERSQ